MTLEDKAEIVISQLREDRDRLQNIIEQIRTEIIDKYMTATGEVNTVAKGCLQIIDKYKAESEVEK